MSVVVNPQAKVELPAELWMLWDTLSDYWVFSAEEGDPSVLAQLTEQDARTAAAHQNKEWGLQCVPIRVK